MKSIAPWCARLEMVFLWRCGYVSFSDSDVQGTMVIIGMDYKFQKIPLNTSLDWKPELNLAKEVGFETATVGLGIRFAF